MALDGIYRILTFLGSLALAVSLVAAGFAVDCLPVTTRTLSEATSDFAGSVYRHDCLVDLAVATRDFTVDNHQSPDADAEALDRLAETVMAAAASSAGDPAVSTRWSAAAKRTVDEYTSGLYDAPTAMRRLADVSDRYALDADALAHLEDCNRLISRATPILLLFSALAVAVLIVLITMARSKAGSIDTKRVGAHILIAAPIVLMVFLLVAGLWAVIDFAGFFSAFHALFFPQGNWMFGADSLLICMYPTAFWMAMGGLWLTVGICASILSCILGALLLRTVNRRKGTEND